MICGGWNSNKTNTEIKHFLDIPPGIWLEEYYDDGRGHSGAFTTDFTPIIEPVFVEACAAGFISGKLMPGFVSKNHFCLTDLGAFEANRLEGERHQAKKLATQETRAGDTIIVVDTIRDLLARMYQQPGSGKSHTELFHTPENADRPIWVREDYPDKIVGTPVAEHVFAEAVRERYISDDFGGWGIRKRCYLLTERGKIEYAYLHVDAEGA
jgi:hypothetical protein